MRDREAYQVYEEGRKALVAGKAEQALSLANKALSLQPAEALFHSLRGDIRLQQKRYKDAITNYDRALERDDGYFHYYLQRGLARLQLDQTDRGRADLEKSIRYLPTAPALNALGILSLDQGDRTAAKTYFPLLRGRALKRAAPPTAH